ncbi:potassium-transporting ATPase subunit F [Nostoc sp. PCC 7107]|uniref:potassium-transporting ATPase subunit F n=1 Tax=Nostoc sp. PCC 7107 TaxID=317936 RepID=UPI00029EDE12|nr:potassium-transporting ATPase subunit F [Nostoc sp. PCC 7107]AFY44520.1 K+-transporting ATPase, F subunit [Nostoc sp. PCC 7107]
MNNEPINLMRAIAYILPQWRKQKLVLGILIGLVLNLGISRGVYAATNTTLQIQFTWAYGVLGAIILGLIIYLLIVVFQPERF